MGTAIQALFTGNITGYFHYVAHKRQVNEYLVDIDKQAEERFERLVKQMKQSQGITEQLKSENALEWVQRMNNIRTCAKEIAEKDIIFA